ncbi:LysR family transcriptional regulator ArgP [Neisseria leonii]|uniref:LysR family transcriptional regulator ArgP n=1 Tax=Neisseria leonii TaxID=2995413 RepID=A0A9X4E0C2_9NEIS|nr:LysR family transcriptional regulator ArgP [Neisseria sp. 51.81]MDD9327112.1 LysR family transcriptional regulator ArgP [Neisseria sp. 51.81]
MWDSKQLTALWAVTERGSFEAAAEQLDLTASAVSQRIRALEEETGFALVTRTRPCRATPQGQKILRFIRNLHWLEQDVRNELAQQNRPYEWPVATNYDSLETWLLPVLAEVARHEAVLPDVQADNEEHTHKLMNEGRVMAAVSTRPQAMAGCEVHHLGIQAYRLLAAPVFAARHFSDGLTKQAVQRAPLLMFDRKDEMQSAFLRRHFGVNTARCAKIYLPAATPFYHAVKLGLGYGMIPDWQSADDLAAGRLVDLNPGHTIDIHLYWHCWKAQSPRLARLNRLFVETARRVLAGQAAAV